MMTKFMSWLLVDALPAAALQHEVEALHEVLAQRRVHRFEAKAYLQAWHVEQCNAPRRQSRPLQVQLARAQGHAGA
jgi:hypothetical protein